MRTKIAVGSATLYLVFLTTLVQLAASPALCVLMYLFSPIVIILMFYLVLTEKNYNYAELGEGEEWGYRDKDISKLGIF